MKTRLLVLVLSLFPYFLSAQIFVKLTLDDDGLYSVVVKTERPIGDAVVGSGQITITAPFGGFEVGDIRSISGEWNTRPDVINQSMSTAISHDYFFIGMRDGDGIGGMDICEEQTLLTFRNVGVNTGRAELITREDPIVTKEIDFQNNPYHDLSIFDSSRGSIVNVSGTYNTITTTHTDETKTICEGESYQFHGRELTEAGIYRDTIQGDNGCDNYAILNLSVNANGNLTQKIVLQPGKTDGKDASVRGYWPDVNFDDFLKFYVYTWTHSGNRGPGRALIDFDLAQIPSNAVIENAALSLYSTGGANLDLADHSGENASIIERITAPWEESTVTWGTQPTTTNTNSLSIGQTSSDNQDFLNMDVTQMVGDMVADPNNSHGFMMRLVTEAQYRNLSFYTSDYTDANKHPKLEITYTVPNQTVANNCDSIMTDMPMDTIPSTDIRQNLIAYYPFNGNANDASLNNNNGIVNGPQLTPDRFNNLNSAYSFDGIDDEIRVNNPFEGVQPFQNQVSIAGWFQTISQKEGGVIISVHNSCLNGSVDDLFAVFFSNHQSNHHLFASAYSHNPYTKVDESTLTDGAWHHFVYTLSDTIGKIYIDGALATEETVSLSTDFIFNPDIELVIGYIDQNNCNFDNHFDGKIDDLSIYSKSLNPIQVQELYELQTPDCQQTQTIISVSLCQGESYEFNGEVLTAGGTYADTLQNGNGCDSISTLELVVLENTYKEVVDSICPGESYDFNGEILTEGGIYIDTLQNSNGCDSISTLDLVILDGGICLDTIPSDTIGQPDIKITNIEKIGTTSAIIEWTSSKIPLRYELQARINGTLIWETARRLNTNATKAYFYGPVNKTFEARVVGYYEDGTQIISDIRELSTYLED